MLVIQPCPPLCDPIDCGPPSSSVHGISRQEYWSGLPLPPVGDLPDAGIEPGSPALQEDSLPSDPQGKSRLKHITMESSSHISQRYVAIDEESNK